MGLPLAIKAHEEGNLALAEEHYQRALDQNVSNATLFQNYGALLRAIGKDSDAISIYEKGIARFPDNIGIACNFANILRSTKPATSLALYVKVIKLKLAGGDVTGLDDVCLSLISLLRELGCHQAALLMIRDLSDYISTNALTYFNLALVLDNLLVNGKFHGDSVICLKRSLDALETLIECSEIPGNDKDLSIFYMGMASHYANSYDYVRSLHLFQKGIDVISSTPFASEQDRKDLRERIDVHSWNYSNSLLKAQQFELGWKLYEHGLRTPCAGKQRWQRALPKPFSVSEVAVWLGEPLAGKSLLLLEEQGIGDAMMFITLLPAILDEARIVNLFLSSRLVPIYKQSFSDYINNGKLVITCRQDYTHGDIQPSELDYQSPLGSICQHRFNSPSLFAPSVPILKPISSTVKSLRAKYASLYPNIKQPFFVGLSWRGGGRADRIIQKSIPIDLLIDTLKGYPDIIFVNLQYGDTKEFEKKASSAGIKLVTDVNINPIKDMHSWVEQVAVCDGVLSIANTTIHGAGGLNIPTMCLLSKFSDWRWLDDPKVTRSYWYPSVGICREEASSGWLQPIDKVKHWLTNHCPMPTGPSFVN